MSGVPGKGGPVPKRTEQRRRRNKPETPTATAPTGSGVTEAPRADESWHPLAVEWFDSLGKSGQAVWYEASDWATARIWGDLLSRQLLMAKPSAVMIATWASAAGELLTTEGARRRLRVELDRAAAADPDADAADATVTDLMSRLGG